MDDFEFGYNVGLFESEGSFTNRGIYPRLYISMVDEEAIHRFSDFVGIDPRLYHTPHWKSRGCQAQWRVEASGSTAMPWIKLSQPYMHERKGRKIEELTGLKWKPVDWSDDFLSGWIVGVNEGDGGFCLNRGKYPHYQLRMIDRDVVARVGLFFALGEPRPHHSPIAQKRGWTPLWGISVMGSKAVPIFEYMIPHFSEVRKARLKEILDVRALHHNV